MEDGPAGGLSVGGLVDCLVGLVDDGDLGGELDVGLLQTSIQTMRAQ